VNILRSGALNVVFLRVLYLADVSGVIHFCRFHIYTDNVITCRFTIVPLLLTFRDIMMRLMLT
jgi:hypothetical protein